MLITMKADLGEVSETEGDLALAMMSNPFFEEAKALVIETQKQVHPWIQRPDFQSVLTEQLD